MSPLLPGTWVRRQAFSRAEGTFETWFAFSRDSLPVLAACHGQFLATAELSYYQTLRIEARQRSFLIGRLCVKEALAALLNSSARTSWEVSHGVFQQPVLKGAGTQKPQTSLSHAETVGMAVVHPEGHPVGVDIELIHAGRRETVESQMTADELSRAAVLGGNAEENLMLMWSAKEALSKVLRTSLMTPFAVYELESLGWADGCLLGAFKNFAQYRAIAFPMGNLAFAVVLPKSSEPKVSLHEFRRSLSGLD